MKEVHILTHEFRPVIGGAGIVCEKVAQTLQATGHQVTVWCPEYVNPEELDFSFSIKAIKGLKGTRDPGCLWTMAKEVLGMRKSLKHSTIYLGEPGPIGVFMLLTLFCKPFWWQLVITLHGSELLRYKKLGIFRKRLFRRLAKLADKIHVLSTYNEKVMLEHFPEIQPKLVRGYGTLVPDETLPAIPESIVKDSNRIRVLCVGRIHPRKGQLRLLEGICGLDPEIQKSIDLVYAGQFVKDHYYQLLQEKAPDCLAAITFTGGISDAELHMQYAQADIFALTSMPYGKSIEGLGLVYLEASSYGLPILANRIGGVGDVVIDGKNGLLSDCENSETLVSNLNTLIRDGELRKQLGESGKQFVEVSNWQKVTDRLFE